jgi:hypothetical protein
MGARTLIKEDLEPNQEILEEFSSLEKRIGKPFASPAQAHRLSFFAAPCTNSDWKALPASSFLGYAVVLTAKMPTDVPIVAEKCPSGDLAYLLESVTRPPGWATEVGKDSYEVRGVTNYYVHCKRVFPTTIGPLGGAKSYAVEGAFFCQQNGLTHVCAHAVIRMILNTADLVGRTVTNGELNAILGIDHENTIADSGLSNDQIVQIIKNYGLSMVYGDFLGLPTVDYAEWMYPLVESGYPVFLTFAPTHAEGHVVAVLGHTMNSDKWDCEAHLAYRPEAFGTYHASSAWVDHFVVNDDNFGMYTCMPPHYLRNRVLPQYDQTQRAIVALSILPKGIDVPPYNAERAAVSLVRNLSGMFSPDSSNRWLKRIWDQIHQGTKGVVARTVICKRDDYLARLGSTRDSYGNGIVVPMPQALLNAPDYLWLTEIALPDLYTANKHKLGDVLTDAKAGLSGTRKIARFVWGWLPGIQIHNDSNGDVVVTPWPLVGHVPIQRPQSVLGPYQEW